MATQVGGLKGWWEHLSERERRMVATLGGAVALSVVAAVVYVVSDRLTSYEMDNAAMREALKDIATHRDAYQRQKSKTAQLEVRMGRGSVQLEGLLETAAKETGVEIAETVPLQAQPAGKSYVEKAVELHLRKVALDQLAKFLRRIETGSNLVVVTALNVRTRDDRHEDLDVQMTVSTWEHAPAEKPGQKKKESKG